MKKGTIYEGTVCCVKFPNKGIVKVEGEEQDIVVKHVIPGQKVKVAVNKVRKGKAGGRLLEVLETSKDEIPSPCPHFGQCGGCSYQSLPYEKQLELKESQVRELLKDRIPEGVFEGIKESPVREAYRNKMEFTFGDEYKDGPLSLGMHKRGSFHDIVTVSGCRIVDEDFRMILECTREYFEQQKVPFYHRMRHDGYLRHLLVRKAVKTGEILADLITTSAYTGEEALLRGWKEALLALPLKGILAGILHTRNDSLADAVKDEGTEILYGQNYFYEELLGLKFKITPFSFFQTNSLGAEVLYETAREYIGDTKDKVVFDLYSGTGTIAQIAAPVAKKVVGVEIIEEAVEAARENAALNELDNCSFWAGDVLKVVDELQEVPDLIILDPPRDGVHPKALEKIIGFGAERIVYISCKPTSLARDLELLTGKGYVPERVSCVDLFPGTVHVETVCLLSNRKSKPDTHVDLTLDMEDYYRIKDQEKQSNK